MSSTRVHVLKRNRPVDLTVGSLVLRLLRSYADLHSVDLGRECDCSLCLQARAVLR